VSKATIYLPITRLRTSWLTRPVQQTFCKGGQFSLPNPEKKRWWKVLIFF